METIYLLIVIFLLCLAVFDLFVGVSNDAVNFLQSAIGARVATFRTILVVASAGVIVGAVMSSGMMDVARHGIMTPSAYTFSEVMTVFLAVMVTDVLVLDVFNSLGMPTSTTVSLVFELLGGTFVMACVKMAGDSSLSLGMLLNSDKALQVIIGIFVSVAIAFVVGTAVMWIARLLFTFNYKRYSRYFLGVFGGVSFTALSYFIFLKGLGASPYIGEGARAWITANTGSLLVYTFLFSTLAMQLLYVAGVNIFRLIVLMGTFALAMAFAGNDLVNFIGVPLAGLDSYIDFTAHANGASPDSYLMACLMQSAKTPPAILLASGVVMIVAMATSKKAQGVIKTSVDLSRQDEGDEMFGSSRAARSIVRACQDAGSWIKKIVPPRLASRVDARFDKSQLTLTDSNAAFDVVRAAVNLVIAAMLITIGTNLKLPLSTTYVTFMVAMGTSLADRAWTRESAVFRVTGVLSVIGGWFLTAGVAFGVCALVCLAMHYGGIVAMALFMAAVVVSLVRSNRKYSKQKAASKTEDDSFRLMMRAAEPDTVWDLLQKHVQRTQAYVSGFALNEYNQILYGLESQNVRTLRHAERQLRDERALLKKLRRRELLGLHRSPTDIAIERNTWFHLGANSNQQFVYCLKRMLDPIKEHVDNSFSPLPADYIEEYSPIRAAVNNLMADTRAHIESNNYRGYEDVMDKADELKYALSRVRKRHIDRMQATDDQSLMQANLVYLNVLQETQEFLSIMRHQLRAAKKFMEN